MKLLETNDSKREICDPYSCKKIERSSMFYKPCNDCDLKDK